MYLRAHQLPRAGSDLAKAHELAPRSAEVEGVLGWLAEEEGKYADAVGHFQKAVQGRPRNLRYLFALAEARQKQGGPDAQAEYQRLIEDGLKIDPDNLFLLRERMTTAVDRGDRAAVNDVTDRLARFAPKWDELGRTTFQEFAEAVHKGGPLPGEVQEPSPDLANVIASQRGYQRDLAAASPPAGLLGEPVARFLRLAPMPVVAAAPDLSLTFTPEPLAPTAPGDADALWAVWLTAKECQATVFVADAHQVRRADGTGEPLPFPGGAKATPPSPFGVVAADFDNDFRTGFLLAGAGGLRFWRQEADGGFNDVTDKTGLPADVLGGDYYGAWTADVDLDGDLDFIVAPRSGPPIVLRNNGDGTFKAMTDVFPGVADVRDFAWADFNHDGTADAAFLDARGKLAVFLNQRGGKFTSTPAPAPVAADGLALAVADADGDGALDLLVFGRDGAMRRLSNDGEAAWTTAELARWDGFAPGTAGPGDFRLLVHDLDNNGALDLIASGPGGARIWMGAGPDKFQPLPVDDLRARLRGRRPQRRRPTRPSRPVRRPPTRPAPQRRRPQLSLAGHPALRQRRGTRPAGRQPRQLLRRGRRGRGPQRTARPEAADGRAVAAFRTRRPRQDHGPSHRLAQRGLAGRIRPEPAGAVRRRDDHAAAPRLVPVPFHLGRRQDAVRDRHPLELAARPLHQRTRPRRNRPNHRLGQGARRSAQAARRPLRRAHHRRPLGDALFRSRPPHRRRSSRRHGNLCR